MGLRVNKSKVITRRDDERMTEAVQAQQDIVCHEVVAASASPGEMIHADHWKSVWDSLAVFGIHDRISYYRTLRSFPPTNPDAALELARRRLGERTRR